MPKKRVVVTDLPVPTAVETVSSVAACPAGSVGIGVRGSRRKRPAPRPDPRAFGPRRPIAPRPRRPGRRGGKIKPDRRAVVRRAVDADVAAGLAHKPEHEAKAQTAPLDGGFGGEKRLEGAFDHTVRHARAGVGYAQQHVASRRAFVRGPVRDSPGDRPEVRRCRGLAVGARSQDRDWRSVPRSSGCHRPASPRAHSWQGTPARARTGRGRSEPARDPSANVCRTIPNRPRYDAV